MTFKSYKNRQLLHFFCLSLALGHLALAVCGAFGIRLPGSPSILRASIEYYQLLVGTDRNFGFFAPIVKGEPRIRFVVVDMDGGEKSVFLEADDNREQELRTSGIYGALTKYFENTELRRTIAASLAAKVFAQNSTAKSVDVLWEHFDVPPMAQYRGGERPKWKQIYRTKFIRNSR